VPKEAARRPFSRLLGVPHSSTLLVVLKRESSLLPWGRLHLDLEYGRYSSPPPPPPPPPTPAWRAPSPALSVRSPFFRRRPPYPLRRNKFESALLSAPSLDTRGWNRIRTIGPSPRSPPPTGERETEKEGKAELERGSTSTSTSSPAIGRSCCVRRLLLLLLLGREGHTRAQIGFRCLAPLARSTPAFRFECACQLRLPFIRAPKMRRRLLIRAIQESFLRVFTTAAGWMGTTCV